MESVACDFCAGTEYQPVAHQTDCLHGTTEEVFDIVRCVACGLHFLNPRPTRDEIGRYYSSTYSFHARRSRLRSGAASMMSILANWPLHELLGLFPPLARRLVPYVKPPILDPVRELFRSGSILDIGCGSGDSAHFWGEKGSVQAYRKFAEVHGVEVADVARAALNQDGIPTYESLADVPSELHFDIIRLNWSLEHVHSPSEHFRFMASRLKEGGAGIITVPNYGGLLYVLGPDCVEIPLHLFHFQKKDIYRYAEKYGLEVVRFLTFSYPGMYDFAGKVFPRMAKAFASPMGLSEAHFTQRFLARLDALEMGNDMMFILKRVSRKGVGAALPG